MALSFTYNAVLTNVPEIYRATSGGTVFSANLGTSTAFDYFTDTAVVDDALYFGMGANTCLKSDLVFNVGTQLATTSITLKWEYYKRNVGWTDMEDVVDDTVNFTVAGSNRVKFPLQWSSGTVTINGLSRIWLRCRISAISGLTEGGANITSRVTNGSGIVICTGGTDETPATYSDVYNWMVANYPYISISKRNDYSFNFTKIAVQFSGRCFTTNEVIELGNDIQSSQATARSSLSYVTSGYKSGDRGYGGSTFIVHGGSNTETITNIQYAVEAAPYIYGSTLKTGKNLADTNNFAGYLRVYGEWIDCNLEMSIYLPEEGKNWEFNNIRIVGSLVISAVAVAPSSNVFYTCVGNTLFYVYRIGWTLTNFGYQFTSTPATLFLVYQGSYVASPTWTFINPSTPLTLLGDSIKPIGMVSSTANFTAVKFYDDSAGTYTDYTAQANSSTINDVPLSGDVGDYYLFGSTTSGTAAYGYGLSCTITNQSNDYEYVWEYWVAAGWRSFAEGFFWDQTENFTKSGSVFLTVDESPLPALSTIDGVNAYWFRARIVTKGSNTPVATKIIRQYCSGISGWSLQEKYSFDLKVINENGDPIENASIVATDENGVNIFTTTTDSDGLITQQTLLKKEWHFDPVNNLSTFISENVYTTFDFIITKAGYETYTSLGLLLDEKIDTIITLKPIIKIRQTIDGKLLLANQPELGSSAKLLEI